MQYYISLSNSNTKKGVDGIAFPGVSHYPYQYRNGNALFLVWGMACHWPIPFSPKRKSPACSSYNNGGVRGAQL